MKKVRTIVIGAALSLSLLGGATSALAAPPDGSFGHHVSTMAREHNGVGPHVQACDSNVSVGQHLQEMRAGTHDCGME